MTRENGDNELPYPVDVVGRFVCPGCGKWHSESPHVYRDRVYGNQDCADRERAQILFGDR